MNIIDKKCSDCGSLKPVEEFRKCAKSRDGLKYYCRDCDDKRAKENYLKNKEQVIKRTLSRRLARKVKDTLKVEESSLIL